MSDHSTEPPPLAKQLRELMTENEKLRAAIQRVIDDEESRPGGWGPDVTAIGWLKEALRND